MIKLIIFYTKFWLRRCWVYILLSILAYFAFFFLYLNEFPNFLYLIPLGYSYWIISLIYDADNINNINYLFRVLNIKLIHRIYIKYLLFYLLILVELSLIIFWIQSNEFWNYVIIFTCLLQFYVLRSIRFINVKLFYFNVFILPLLILFLLLLSSFSLYLIALIILINTAIFIKQLNKSFEYE